MTLQNEFSSQERLETYKKVLQVLIELGERKDSHGLCLLIPKIHFNLNLYSYLSNHIDEITGKSMCFVDTTLAFPELTFEIISELQSNAAEPIQVLNNLRINFIKKFISSLEKSDV
jgi:hypothetical protein